MSRNPFEEFVHHFARQDRPLHYPDAVVKLYDAIKDYLRADKALGEEMLSEDYITLEQFNAAQAANAPLVEWLKDHEDQGVCCNLHGLIKERR